MRLHKLLKQLVQAERKAYLSQSLKYALSAAENLKFSARVIAAGCSDMED